MEIKINDKTIPLYVNIILLIIFTYILYYFPKQIFMFFLILITLFLYSIYFGKGTFTYVKTY